MMSQPPSLPFLSFISQDTFFSVSWVLVLYVTVCNLLMMPINPKVGKMFENKECSNIEIQKQCTVINSTKQQTEKLCIQNTKSWENFKLIIETASILDTAH